MTSIAFALQSSIVEIRDQQFLMNCPFPTFSAKPTPFDITNNVHVQYTMNYSNTFANHVFVFSCTFDAVTGVPQVSIIHYESSEGFFSTFDNAFAWIGYIYSWFTMATQKLVAFATLIFLYIDAPAQASGLDWFSWISGIFITFIALGTFMVIRGS